MNGRILVGSCSWTDPTLIARGRFYPAGVTSAEARLRYYAGQFPIVEVDSTYYAPPDRRERDALGGAHARRLHLRRQGLRRCSPGTWRASTACRRGCATRSCPRPLGKSNVYRDDLDPAAVELLWREHRRGARAAARRPASWARVLFQFPPWFTRSASSHRLPRGGARARCRAGAAGGGVPRRRLDGRRRRRQDPAPARGARARAT